MWRAEADPRTRSTGVLLEILDREPDWDRLVAAHDRVSQQIPRLRERAVEPLLSLFPPAWSPDPHFDPGYHLQRVRLPGPGTMRQLLDLAQGILARPLDKARPPWEAVLVEGLEDGRAGYLLKVHHSLSDGLGLIQLLTLAHSRTPEPGNHQLASPPAPRPLLSPASLLAGRLRQRILDVPSELIRRSDDSLRLVGRTVRSPRTVAGETLRFGRSLRRVLTPPPTERSLLLRGGGELDDRGGREPAQCRCNEVEEPNGRLGPGGDDELTDDLDARARISFPDRGSKSRSGEPVAAHRVVARPQTARLRRGPGGPGRRPLDRLR